MSDRWDVVRSYVRSAGQRLETRIRESDAWQGAQRVVEALKRQEVIITTEQLTTAVAHAAGVRGATVTVRNREIQIDATLSEGEPLQFALIPKGARFAPRGAKEISFTIAPPEATGMLATREIVSNIAGLIAGQLWSFVLLRATKTMEGAIVEKERADTLRVDLRTLPAVQRVMRGNLAFVLEVMEIGEFDLDEDELRVTIRLPPFAA